tara:strand:- start:32739 stop:33122 length:384 start_codon:yes stop_codon:yes gene_type:complete
VQIFIIGPIIFISKIYLIFSLLSFIIFWGTTNEYGIKQQEQEFNTRVENQKRFSDNMKSYCKLQKEISLDRCICTYKALEINLNNDELMKYKNEELSSSKEFFVNKARNDCLDLSYQKWIADKYLNK